MRSRARSRLSGALALLAASGLGGTAVLAQTTAGAPPGTVLPPSEQNAGAPPAGGGAPAIGVEEVRAFVGKDVLTPSGNVLGTLDTVTTNSAGQPEKLVISRGGFLGLFQSQYTADWNAAKPKIENGKLVFALTPQDLSKQTANK